jgi:hypothetical protein
MTQGRVHGCTVVGGIYYYSHRLMITVVVVVRVVVVVVRMVEFRHTCVVYHYLRWMLLPVRRSRHHVTTKSL